MASPPDGTASDTRKSKRPAASARSRRQPAPAPRYRHGFSSGVFGLPSSASVVDWVVLNNSTTEQTIRVTLYQADFNARKSPVDPPGPMTLTIEPGVTSGRAYSVGVQGELHVGRYYELVVEMDDPRLLPSVQIWDTPGATVIAGTLIPPGAFVEL
jgi:hypothetical protein